MPRAPRESLVVGAWSGTPSSARGVRFLIFPEIKFVLEQAASPDKVAVAAPTDADFRRCMAMTAPIVRGHFHKNLRDLYLTLFGVSPGSPPQGDGSAFAIAGPCGVKLSLAPGLRLKQHDGHALLQVREDGRLFRRQFPRWREQRSFQKQRFALARDAIAGSNLAPNAHPKLARLCVTAVSEQRGDAAVGRANRQCVPAPLFSTTYAVLGSMRTAFAWAALGSSIFKMPSFKIALTFELSTSAGRSTTRRISFTHRSE